MYYQTFTYPEAASVMTKTFGFSFVYDFIER